MEKEENKKQRPSLFTKDYQKDWSVKYKYKHIHTGEYCTFEAYVAEYLILRWTDTFKMDKPSYKFWTAGDKYHDSFMRNLKALQSLKKKFSEEIIIEAIRSSFFENIYHVGIKAYNPKGWKYNQVALNAIKCYNNQKVESEKVKKSAQQNQQQIFEEELTQEKKKTRRTKTYGKKSIINKLRNL